MKSNKLIVFLSCALLSAESFSSTLNVSPELELSQRNAIRIKQDEKIAQNKQMALLKLESNLTSFSDITMIARGFNDQYYKNSEFDGSDVSIHQTDSELRELYSDLYFGDFSLRIGKQQVTWGESDYFRTMDVINSLDLREFLLSYTENFQQARNTLNMLNISHQGDIWESQLLYIPDFKEDTLPSASADFAPINLKQLVSNLGQPNNLSPDAKSDNAAWAISSKASLDVGDIGFYAYDGWNSQAVFNMDSSEANLNYYRRKFVATSYSSPLGAWTMRSDFAHYMNEKFNAKFSTGSPFFESDMNQFLLGADYNAGTLTFSCQLLHKKISSASEILFDSREVNSFSVYIAKDFMGDRLSASHLILGESENLNTLNETRLIYRFSDNFKANVGLDWFSGNSDTSYGQFKNQSRIFTGFSYFI